MGGMKIPPSILHIRTVTILAGGGNTGEMPSAQPKVATATARIVSFASDTHQRRNTFDSVDDENEDTARST